MGETATMALVRLYAPLGYLTAYLAAAALGRLTVVDGSGLALFWPAAGIAALWMLRGTTKRQLGLDAGLLLVGTTCLFLVLGVKPDTAALFGIANLVQGFGVRVVLTRLRQQPLVGPITLTITAPRTLLKLALASMAASVLSLPFATTGLWLTSGEWSVVNGWVVRNYSSTFVVTAAALTIFGALQDRGHARPHGWLTVEPRRHVGLELSLALALTMAAGLLVLTSPRQLPIAYVMIASSAWIGLRFSPPVGAVYSVSFGTTALLCTLAGWGPFGLVEDPMTRAIAAQFFVAVTTMIVLMLSFGVSEHVRLTGRLRESEARASKRADLLDAVTTVMTDGLSVIDTDGTVLLTNPAGERMTGLPVGSPRMESLPAHGIFNVDGSEANAAELPRARALRGEMVPAMDLLRIDPQTGQQAILSVSAAPLKTTPDEPAAAVIVLHDVTKLRAQRRELENFAGVVAHDLNGPLAGVISWAELLEEQLNETVMVDGQALHTSVRKIRTTADRMANLIADLLAYTQAQSAELSLQSVCLDDMVAQIARDLHDTFHLEIPVVESTHLGSVLADPTLVRQLLTNLIGNAVKYVAPGVTPRIAITATRTADMLQIRVSDNGIGIPDQDLGRIFDSFFRASGTQGYPGTGLGLAICAQTVERHGGRISARRG